MAVFSFKKILDAVFEYLHIVSCENTYPYICPSVADDHAGMTPVGSTEIPLCFAKIPHFSRENVENRENPPKNGSFADFKWEIRRKNT